MKKYTGKTLNDVLNSAAKEKGVSVEELTYFVTEEKQGFLGIGASVTAEVYASCDVKEFLFNYIGEFFTDYAERGKQRGNYRQERSDAAGFEYRCARSCQFSIPQAVLHYDRYQSL